MTDKRKTCWTPERRAAQSNRMRGKNNPNYAKVFTDEERENLSNKISELWKDPEYQTLQANANHAGFKGKTHTDKYKKMMSDIQSGKNNKMYGRSGSLSPTYGRKHTPEERAIMSEKAKERANNPEWKKSFSEQQKEQ
jgi:hypothetical protein